MLLFKRRVEINKYRETTGLSAIFYFTGDVSIFIDEHRLHSIDADTSRKFLKDLEEVSHTMARFPSVVLAWFGQAIVILSYFKGSNLIESINNLMGMV